jgi:hypothetical protein
MPLRLRITTDDIRVALDMLSNNGHIAAGTEIEIPGGARMRFDGAEKRAKGNVPGTLDFRIDESAGTDTAQVADWLFEHLQGRVEEVQLGTRQVPVEREALRQALERGL